MNSTFSRRTATKVIKGRIHRKNRNNLTDPLPCIIERRLPGRGYRHIISKSQLETFIPIIPHWYHLIHRLEKIVLAPGNDCDGFHQFHWRNKTAAIFLCAWHHQPWTQVSCSYFEAHRSHLDLLGVEYKVGLSSALCKFTTAQARAFIMLHVFIHELGHHSELLAGRKSSRSVGECYAEKFANQLFPILLPQYIALFGDPKEDPNNCISTNCENTSAFPCS